MKYSFKEKLSAKSSSSTTPNPKPNHHTMTRYHSAPFPSCFRPPSSTTTVPALEYPHAPPSSAAATTTNPNLTTCLYQTHLGIFSLTWSRSLLSRSLHLNLHPHLSVSSSSSPSPSLNSPSFHLSLKPFLFWNKQGFKKLTFSSEPTQEHSNSIWVFWDLTHARFGPGPEPESGFYIAVLSEGEMTLLVGDMEKEAFLKTRAKRAASPVSLSSSSVSSSCHNKNKKKEASLVLRREHVVGKNKSFTTRTNLGGKSRLISIELNENHGGEKEKEDPRLVIRFDQKRVLQVKHLKWKFRGSERIEVDGHPIQLSWDVYNWLFEAEESNQEDGYALFTFRFEKQGSFSQGVELFEDGGNGVGKREKGVVMWSQDSCGLNYERKKMKKRLLMKTRSPSFSSSSISSVSSGCSSVLEWESVEENELKGPTGFSLLVYAWKS